jgi:hypothetical protein
MGIKVIYRKIPEGYNEVSSPSEDGKRVIFDSRPLDARFVMAAELELELDVVVVRCLVGEVLRKVVL